MIKTRSVVVSAPHLYDSMTMHTLQDRFLSWWNRPPQRFSKNILANQLGWQFLRALWFNVWRRIGFVSIDADIQEHAKRLRTEGAILIPDFLPPEIFAEIRKEYETALAQVSLKPLAYPYITAKTDKTRLMVGHISPEQGTRLYALLDTHLIKNDFLKRLGSTVVNRQITTYRPPQLFINKIGNDTYPDLNTDIYYHSDAPYPGVKAFLYLSNTDEENGAFMYTKKSHKLTWKRLWWEYKKSIEWAKHMRASGKPGDELGRAWHCLTRDEEVREGIAGTSMVGKANSLMMFNVMGFHRRGEFTSNRPREFALVYYRA